jgi:type I restriction enzyme S subunit
MKPGYKQTEAGVIPEDWEVKTIDQVSFVTSGKRLPLGSSLVAQPTPHPYVRVTDMRPGTVELSEIKYVPEDVFPAIKRYRIYCEDIFISVAGSLGIVGKVPRELHGANLTENADRITNITCSQDFLLYVMGSPLIQNTIDSIQTVGAQPKLALTRIRKFEIRHPPLPEQRAIATALSDVDALLAALDRLIAKKRDLKQAAMQQLLTGQTRLPGFHGVWESSTLRQAAEIAPGINKPVSEMGRGALYVTVQDVYHGTSIRTDRLGRIRVSPVEIEARNLEPGDIVFGKSSVKREGIGYPSQFLGCGEPVVFSGFTYRARARRGIADATFLFYSLRSNVTRKWLIDNSQASALTNINQRIADSIPVTLPPTVPEQTAIAEVLSGMDAELAGLEQRREKTRALKQGMMQELLTGRTRLV